MKNIFFYHEGTFEDVASKVFKSLGILSNIEGDSTNSLDGIYSSFSIFGLNIKLELNSYDYEDEYNFMITIYHDILSGLKINDDVTNNIAITIVTLLSKNLEINIALEKADTLKVYSVY